MIVALIDNGSLAPAAHQNLRRVAAAISEHSGVTVRAVSWKHSDRIPSAALDHTPAWTLTAFVRSFFALGQRDFVFIPFFVSPQGAIGSSLRTDLEVLHRELGEFEFAFTEGLATAGVIPKIIAERVRESLANACPVISTPPPLLVVDHGGPSAVSAVLRNQLVDDIRRELGPVVGTVRAASMEGDHPPLLADLLQDRSFTGRDVIVAPLFLSPGRHAGPRGDIARICAASAARCHLTQLVGNHPRVVTALAAALHDTLSNVHAHSLA